MLPSQTLLIGLAVAAAATILLLALQRRLPLVRSLLFPLLVVAFAAGLGLAWGLGLGEPDVARHLLRWTWVFLAVVLLHRLVTWYLFDVHLGRHRQLKVPPLLPAVVQGAGYLLAALVVLSSAFPGLDVGPLLATSAVSSLVLGLALQPILTNFFAGVVIALERPFRLHDWIRVGDDEGQVTRIAWRTTHLRTRDNDTVIFPNATIAQERLLNFLYPHPLHLCRLYVGVHYRTPPYRVKTTLLESASRVGGVLDRPSPEVYVVEFDDSAITYELRVWVENVGPLPRIESDLRSSIWEEFRKRDIVIPFPIRTLEVARPGRRREGEPRARLVVVSGGEAGTTVPLEADPVTVGRGADCRLVLREPAVSKQHLRLSPDGEGWTVEDLGSTHGTLVNGEPVQSRRLADLDRIRVGDTEMVFETDER